MTFKKLFVCVAGRKPISPIHESEELEEEPTVPAGSRLAESRILSAQKNRLLPARPTATPGMV